MGVLSCFSWWVDPDFTNDGHGPLHLELLTPIGAKKQERRGIAGGVSVLFLMED